MTSTAARRHGRDRALSLRVVLEQPPAGVDFGLQKGRGSGYETVQTQRSTDAELAFEFTVAVPDAGDVPDFAGPFVQGPKGARFVYIDIGTAAGQSDTPWTRRLKVPLTGITMDAIDLASSRQEVLEARVPGTGRDGGPNCATVKPFGGWHRRPDLPRPTAGRA